MQHLENEDIVYLQEFIFDGAALIKEDSTLDIISEQLNDTTDNEILSAPFQSVSESCQPYQKNDIVENNPDRFLSKSFTKGGQNNEVNNSMILRISNDDLDEDPDDPDDPMPIKLVYFVSVILIFSTFISFIVDIQMMGH